MTRVTQSDIEKKNKEWLETKKKEFHFKLIDDIVLNAIALDQKKEVAYSSLIKKLSNKKLLAQIHQEHPYAREDCI